MAGLTESTLTWMVSLVSLDRSQFNAALGLEHFFFCAGSPETPTLMSTAKLRTNGYTYAFTGIDPVYLPYAPSFLSRVIS